MRQTTSPISTIIPSLFPVAPYVSVYQQSTRYQPVTLLRELQIESIKREIAALALLQEDWDGYGAARIQNQTVTNAQIAADLVLRTAPMPDITPNPNGTISMEWESKMGVAYLEIGKTQYSCYVSRQAKEPLLYDGAAGQIGTHLGTAISVALFPILEKPSSTIRIDMLLTGRDPEL